MNQVVQGEIRRLTGIAIDPKLSSQIKLWDLYEAYLFSVIVRSARRQSAAVDYVTASGSQAQHFVFRTSPGQIYSRNPEYTHAVLRFQNRPPLEVHVGIMVQGTSRVTHECDVAVLYQSEADYCRTNQTVPRNTELLLTIEAKYLTSHLGIGLGRNFLGLLSDLGAGGKNSSLVANVPGPNVERPLASKSKEWFTETLPNTRRLTLLESHIEQVFLNFQRGARR